MHARVSTFHGSPGAVDAGIDNFRQEVVPFLTGIEGEKGCLLLVDRQSGTAVAITLWESEEAMQASEGDANRLRLRAQTIQQMGASEAPTVERYEVAVFEN